MLWENPIALELATTYLGVGIFVAIIGGSIGASVMGASPTLFSLGFVTLLAVSGIGWFRSAAITGDPDAMMAWALSGDPFGDPDFRWFAAMLLAAPFLFGWLIGGALKAALNAGRD